MCTQVHTHTGLINAKYVSSVEKDNNLQHLLCKNHLLLSSTMHYGELVLTQQLCFICCEALESSKGTCPRFPASTSLKHSFFSILMLTWKECIFYFPPGRTCTAKPYLNLITRMCGGFISDELIPSSPDNLPESNLYRFWWLFDQMVLPLQSRHCVECGS